MGDHFSHFLWLVLKWTNKGENLFSFDLFFFNQYQVDNTCPTRLQLFIKMLNGKHKAIELDKTSSIRDLKQIISDREGIPFQHLWLATYNANLDDSMLLENINHGYHIQLFLRLNGGAQHCLCSRQIESGKDFCSVCKQ